MEKREDSCGVVTELCKGRRAFASAHIDAKDTNIDGTACFYYTPIGMLVCVSVVGLEENGGVYSLEVVTESGGRFTLPPLYEKSGRAWCVSLTGKISACEILGGRINVMSDNSGDTEQAATGKIRSPMIGEFKLRAAE